MSLEQLDQAERARLAVMAHAGSFEPDSILWQAIELAEAIYRRGNAGLRNVMVAFSGGFHEKRTRRHVKLFRDGGGLYVRLGKRGNQKRYLKDMAGARIVDKGVLLAVFFEHS